ncbi:MAG: DUF3467 domain-containing protein [Bacteroidetes bacterium]|nr:DUF3467 domain-containing protein [Bacteroidota bacterium]
MDIKSKEKDLKQATIIIKDDPVMNRAYSNYVAVGTSMHECNLTFCQTDPLNVKDGVAEAKVVAKIAIPNSLVDNLLRTIEKNFSKYQKIVDNEKK